MKTLIKITLFVVLATFFVAGCTTPEPTTPSSTTDKVEADDTSDVKEDTKEVVSKSFDPCTLLTAADVKAEMDLTPVNTNSESEPNAVGQTICFHDLSEDEMIFAQLSVQRDTDLSPAAASGGMDVASLYDSGKEFVDAAEDIDGVGDEAYYGGSGLGLGKGLHVLLEDKGVSFNVVIGLGFGNEDDAEHLKIETALAKKVIGRL